MTEAHPICAWPIPDCCGWFSSQNFFHENKSSTHVVNGSTFKIEYGSGLVAGFYSKDSVSIGGVSITDYTFAEVTDGLGVSYQHGKFDGICGMAWGSISGGRISYSSRAVGTTPFAVVDSGTSLLAGPTTDAK